MAKRKTAAQRLSPRDRVLAIIESFDGATATPVLSHLKLQAGKKLIGWYMDDHHGSGRLEINCRGRLGRSQQLVAQNPDVYFVPSYHGKKGNIGIWLDVEGIDWDEVAQILLDAYALANPDIVLIRNPTRPRAKRKGTSS
jgi:hypothetical protein